MIKRLDLHDSFPQPSGNLPHDARNEGQAPEVTPQGQLAQEEYPKYEVNNRIMRNWEDALLYWSIYGGVLMEKLDHMTPWHVLLDSAHGDGTIS